MVDGGCIEEWLGAWMQDSLLYCMLASRHPLVHVHMCLCKRVSVSVYAHALVCLCACVLAYIRVFVHVCVHVFVHVRAHAMHAFTHLCMGREPASSCRNLIQLVRHDE